MGRILKTAAAIVAVLFVAAGTMSAQEKKNVEKKVTIVTVDEKGVKKDTTFVTTDTMDFEGERIMITTKDGKVMHGKGEGDNVMIWTARPCEPGTPQQVEMRRMRMMAGDQEAQEGVSYHISVDGVTVNIRAPKEKAKEADLILTEVKKILMK